MGIFADTSAQDRVEKTLANISADAINSNQQAVPVPYLAGRAYVTGAYISPAYNPKAIPIQTKVGKGDSQTTGYKYFADFALMFCMGGRRPVDAVYKVIVDSEIAWSGNIQRGQANKEVFQVENYGTIHLFWGTETQGIDSVLLTPRSVPIGGGNPQDSTTWPPNTGPNATGGFAAGDPNPYSGHYDQHPAYRGQCYAVFKNWKLGRDRTSVPNISMELKRGCPWFGFNWGGADANDQGVNPAAILYDWLTDTRFGMALPDTALVRTSFDNLWYALNAQGARLTPLITEQDDFRQVVAELLEYYDGWIRNNTGQIEVGLWSHGTILSGGTLTDDDLLGDPELEPTGWGPTLNEISVVYNDRTHHFNTYAQSYRDPNNFRITGSPRPAVLQRPWITDAAYAKRYAREYGAIQALPTTRGELHVKREWLTNNRMLPGNVFLYQSGFYGLSFYLRLLEVEHAADSAAVATLTVEWERSVWPSLYIPPPFQGPGGFVLGPRAIWNSRITEIPYLLSDHRFLTQVVCLAVKGNVEVTGYRIWASFDGGATYQCLANSNNFGALGVVATATGHDTGWFYVYGPGHDEIVISQTDDQKRDDTLLCFMGAEVMSIGTVYSYENGLKGMYWLRGRFGTSEVQYPINTVAFFIPRAQMHILDNAGFVPGATVLFKLQPFTADTDYDLSAITPTTYAVHGWAPIDPPVINPPGGSFVGSVTVSMRSNPGTTIRFTYDGSPPTGTSLVWAQGAQQPIPFSVTLRAVAVAPDTRISREVTAIFTKVQQIPGQPVPAVQCAVPARSFSGTKNYSGGNLTLTPVTGGSAISFRLNNGATQAYNAPIHLNCTPSGDTIAYWATRAGYDNSPVVTFDNTKIVVGGGGGNPAFPPMLPP